MTVLALVVCATAALTLAAFTGWFIFHEHHARKDK